MTHVRPALPYAAPADVVHEEDYLPGNEERLRLFWQNWMPPNGKPVALLLMIHGTDEHGGMFASVAERWARAGYGVYAVDLEGWGRSPGRGAFGFVRSHDDYVRDVVATLDMVREQYPGVRVFGVGESLGGTVLLRAEIQGATHFDGLVLSDPGYKPNPGFGGVHGPAFITRGALWLTGVFGKAVPNMPAVPSDAVIRSLTCSANTRDRFLRDPYISHDWLPAAYVTTFEDSQKLISNGLEKISVPLLIVHGEKDGMVPVSSSREILKRVSSSDKALFTIPNGCHASLVEERSWPHSARIVEQWLNVKVKGVLPTTN